MVNFGEVRRPNPLSSPPRWCPWDLFRSFKICSDAKERLRCGKQREATAPLQSLIKLQPWFLSLQWKTWLRQNCSQGSCACSGGPALGQTTLMMILQIEFHSNRWAIYPRHSKKQKYIRTRETTVLYYGLQREHYKLLLPFLIQVLICIFVLVTE